MTSFLPAVLILGEDETPLELLQVIAARIPTKAASYIIKLLGSQSPIPNLKHLKRIRKCQLESDGLEAIICPCAHPLTEGSCSDALFDCLPDAIAKALKEVGCQLFVTTVASRPPRTKEQWHEWSKFWHMSWKPSDKTSTADKQIDAQQQGCFEQHMRNALSLASQHGVANAAVVVDPDSDTVIAASFTQRQGHPLHHAAMTAIDLVAQRNCTLAEGSDHDDNCCMHIPDPATEQPNTGDTCCSSKRLKLESGPVDCRPPMNPAEPDPRTSSTAVPYMCTGYDIYIVQEPCIMCSMALVHSRLRRVIYCRADANHGALGSRIKLHAVKSLNHHYEVYWLQEAT